MLFIHPMKDVVTKIWSQCILDWWRLTNCDRRNWQPNFLPHLIWEWPGYVSWRARLLKQCIRSEFCCCIAEYFYCLHALTPQLIFSFLHRDLRFRNSCIDIWDPLSRIQEEKLVSRQGAKDKIQQIVAPILSHHDPQALAIQAFGNIRPRISLRFEELGLTLKDGRSILSGVTGYFGHSKVGLSWWDCQSCFLAH